MKKQELYSALGVSADKADVHEAIKDLDKGLFPNAFCKVLPDIWQNSSEYVVVLHADTAGTKPSIAYLDYMERGDLSVWSDIAQDALVMNLDDMACIACFENIAISSTIARNKHLINGDVISEIINGAVKFVENMKSYGLNLYLAGGETADVGDVVRTIDVGYTTASRMKKKDVFVNNISPGDLIVGFASFGEATYETKYNSGIGSNGLTAAKHQTLHSDYRVNYPESCNPAIDESISFSGKYSLQDTFLSDREYRIGDLLLSPTRTFMPLLKKIFNIHKSELNGVIHNTGGALTKVMKFAPGVKIIKDNLLPIPPVFQMLASLGTMSMKEMFKVYNMGQRLEIYTDSNTAKELISIADSFNISAQIIGRVEASDKTELEIVHQGNHYFY